jgi:undecaprenyl diphosphate synthase
MRLWPFDKGKRKSNQADIVPENVPAHIAVIMDGNGRWAEKRGLPRVAGHRSGMKRVKEIAIAANDLGVKVLTMYAFSTENWKRPKEEVDFLMHLPQEFFPKEIDELIRNNVRVRMIGNKEHLPPYTIKPVTDAIQRTASNTGMILNFALNYGSRDEMLQAMRGFVGDVLEGRASPDQLTEERFSDYLHTRDLPDPDLLIRTSGEQRISNFMLWQLAYTELFFTDVYWPDFTKSHFYAAIADYQKRRRRYGAL